MNSILDKLVLLLLLAGCSAKSSDYPTKVEERVLIPKQEGWSVNDTQQSEHIYSATWSGSEGLLTRLEVSKRSGLSAQDLIDRQLSNCPRGARKEYFSGEERGYETTVVGAGCNEKLHFIKVMEGKNHLHLVDRVVFKVKVTNTFELSSYLSYLNTISLCPVGVPPASCVR